MHGLAGCAFSVWIGWVFVHGIGVGRKRLACLVALDFVGSLGVVVSELRMVAWNGQGVVRRVGSCWFILGMGGMWDLWFILYHEQCVGSC